MAPETTVDLQQLGSREDVLSVLSQVERSIGLLRMHADDEAQRAAESSRLAREFASLEEERARLLERQCTLESQLAAARGTMSEFERRVRDAESRAVDANARAQSALDECARIEGEALSLSLAHDEELRQEREAQRHAFAARTEELQRGYEARVEELERALAEHAATGRSQDALGAELCAVQAELDALRAEAAARRSDDEALRTEAEARCIELEAALAETRATLATMESRVAELSARVDECAAREAEYAARETEYAARVNEYAAREAEYAARVNEYASRETEHEARMQDYAARAAESSACANAATERLAAVEAELCAERARHANFSPENSATPTNFVAPLDEAQRAASFDSAVEARAGELAAERVQQLLAPKLAGLAQAAAFLKTRRERLAALRSGLKRRARELKVEREALAAMPAQSLESVDRGFEVGDAESGELATVRAERAALASEKQELTDLRVILEASEASLARRAAGTRMTTAVAIALAFSALAALASWHLAGALAPTPALAQVELSVSSRAPEGQQRGAAAQDDSNTADSTGHGARIEQWIDARVAEESFAGVVAGRLLDRGRTRAEGDALAASFADRLSVESEGSTVRLALRGQGLDETSATLDAIATSIVTEANRDPARRSDFLRVGIANAKQEIGRTVFAHAEALPDPERVIRAGGFFGGFFAAAAVVAGVFAIFARRATALATQGY